MVVCAASQRSSPVKNRMRETCTSGSVGGEGGNILAYPAIQAIARAATCRETCASLGSIGQNSQAHSAQSGAENGLRRGVYHRPRPKAGPGGYYATSPGCYPTDPPALRVLSSRPIASYRQLAHFRRIDPFGEGQWPSAPVRTIEGRGAYHDDLHEGGGRRI